MPRLWVAGFLVLAMVAAGCAQAAPPAGTAEDELVGQMRIAGSTTIQPLAEKLAEAFGAVHAKVRIDVAGGGSSVGIKSAGQGTVDVGMASREVKDTELKKLADLQVHRIAVDGMAIVVNRGVAIDNLSRQQVKRIFAGEIKSWQEVGGADQPITVVSREEGSGTREFFQEYFMGADELIVDRAILQGSNGAVRSTVAATPNAIGYLSFGYVDQGVKALAIDGVEPNEASLRAGTYKAWRYLNVVTRGEPMGLAKAWIDYALSPEGQQIVAEEGYLGVK